MTKREVATPRLNTSEFYMVFSSLGGEFANLRQQQFYPGPCRLSPNGQVLGQDQAGFAPVAVAPVVVAPVPPTPTKSRIVLIEKKCRIEL